MTMTCFYYDLDLFLLWPGPISTMTLTSFYNDLDLDSLVSVEGLDKEGPAERIGVSINVELVEEVIVTCKSCIHTEEWV